MRSLLSAQPPMFSQRCRALRSAMQRPQLSPGRALLRGSSCSTGLPTKRSSIRCGTNYEAAVCDKRSFNTQARTHAVLKSSAFAVSAVRIRLPSVADVYFIMCGSRSSAGSWCTSRPDRCTWPCGRYSARSRTLAIVQPSFACSTPSGCSHILGHLPCNNHATFLQQRRLRSWLSCSTACRRYRPAAERYRWPLPQADSNRDRCNRGPKHSAGGQPAE